jgi:hypothetical protein
MDKQMDPWKDGWADGVKDGLIYSPMIPWTDKYV